MKNYDVIILGAGLAGLTTAYECQRAGLQTLVLEARRLGEGASSGVVGALSPHMPEHWDDKKEYQFQSMQLAEKFWPEIEALSGIRTGYRRGGRWQAISSARDYEKAEMRARESEKTWRGQAHWRVIQPDSQPFLGAHLGIIEENLSAQIYPAWAMRALAVACEKTGVVIKENTRVLQFGNARVLAEKEYHAPHIVIAGGYDAWPLLRPYFGAEFGEGTKGQGAILALNGDWNFPMLTGDGFYVVPHAKRLLGVGSSSERYWWNRNVDAHLEELLSHVKATIALPKFEVIERWSGIRPRAYRPDPLIGELSSGVLVNAGGFKTGFSFANRIARDLRDMILGKEVIVPSNFLASTHLLFA